jgi:transposase-like protein
MVRRLERDLPELLSFFAFPRHLWRKLRTTNVIERCFVEVRRRTRPDLPPNSHPFITRDSRF